MRDVRGIEAPWPHRRRRNVVVACLDDPRAKLEGLELSCPGCGPIAWGDPGA